MFLATIGAQLGFLEQNDETGVFLEFPLETRKSLAREITNVFAKGIVKGGILKSATHVKTVMEIVGQTFNLAVATDTIEIISNATELYRKWLLEDPPPPIKRDTEQVFIREIFNHFSMLFKPQSGEEREAVARGVGGDSGQEGENVLSHHTALCNTVLDIFAKVGRSSNIELSDETWEHLLKVVLGITDSLLNLPRGDDHLSKNLCANLLKVLFELWLRSETEGVMWQNLRDLVWHWRHRMPTIQIWNDVMHSLTNRVVRLLYGPSCGTDKVVFSDNIELTLPDEYLVYAWYRMLHLLGDFESIPSPDNYLEALKGIGKLSQVFLSIGEKKGFPAALASLAASAPPPVPQRGSFTLRRGGSAKQMAAALAEATQEDGHGLDPAMLAAAATASLPSVPSSTGGGGGGGGGGSASASGADIGQLEPPDGNTILHILGSFLFEAINIYKEGLERGKAKALEVLANLFSRKSKTDFDDAYLAYYYRGLEQAILNGHPMYISTVLLNTIDFFPCEFRGSHILIPNFILAMKRVLSTGNPFEGEGGGSASTGAHIPPNVLRRAAIKTLGTIICFSSHYGSTSFQRKSPDKRISSIRSYTDLDVHFNELLLCGLNTEVDSLNLQSLLWTSASFVYESVETNPTFFTEFIRLLLRRIMQVGNASWGEQVSLTALQVLSILAELHDYLSPPEEEKEKERERKGDTPEIVSLSSTKSRTSGPLIVNTLSKFFEIHCLMQCAPSAPLDDLIVQCLVCMQNWIMPSDWIFNDPATFKVVLGVIDKARGEAKGYHTPTEKIKEAANELLSALLNHHGQFPPSVGPSNLSALPTEADILASRKETSKNISCFIFNKSIISVIRHARNNGDVGVTVVVRDNTGKYVWNANMNYFPSEIVMPTDEMPKAPEKDPLAAIPTPDDINYQSTLFGGLDQSGVNQHDLLAQQIKKRIQDEAALLRKTGFGDCDTVAKRPEMPVVNEETDTTATRLFLSHLGFLSLGNRNSFYLLSADPAKPFNFLQHFSQIDQSPERMCLRIGVIYVSAGHMSADHIFDNNKGSKEYFDFLSRLGWTVDVRTHTGYMGGLDAAFTGNLAPYYADLTTEAIFHVSTIIPNRDHKIRLLTNDKVLISWVEDLDEYEFAKLENFKSQINIVINPLPVSGLYRIRVLNHNRKVKDVGPLLDGMTVSKHILASLVRLTAINASKTLSEDGNPYTVRKYLLDDFNRRHKLDVPLSKFYASHFSFTKK